MISGSPRPALGTAPLTRASCIAVCDYATYPDIRDPERCAPDEICVGPFVFDDLGACLVP